MKSDYIIAGGKIYTRCPKCGKLVRVNKPFLGSLHFCAKDKPHLTDQSR